MNRLTMRNVADSFGVKLEQEFEATDGTADYLLKFSYAGLWMYFPDGHRWVIANVTLRRLLTGEVAIKR